jgi:hypothetical protein
MLKGIGAGVGATDSVRCTDPFRLAGLGFEAAAPGCINPFPFPAQEERRCPPRSSQRRTPFLNRRAAINRIGWSHFEFPAEMPDDRALVPARRRVCLLSPGADVQGGVWFFRSAPSQYQSTVAFEQIARLGIEYSKRTSCRGCGVSSEKRRVRDGG